MVCNNVSTAYLTKQFIHYYYKKHGGYYVTKQLRFNSNIF